jgi:hypothetical protein
MLKNLLLSTGRLRLKRWDDTKLIQDQADGEDEYETEEPKNSEIRQPTGRGISPEHLLSTGTLMLNTSLSKRHSLDSCDVT